GIAFSIGTLRDFPMLTPSTQFSRCSLRFLTNCLAPRLLKPSRFINARSRGKRNRRGFGLPGCGSLVTVPTSMNPKPSAHSASTASPFLSNPAARPIGFENVRPNRFRFPNGERCNRFAAALRIAEGSSANDRDESANLCAVSAGRLNRSGRTMDEYSDKFRVPNDKPTARILACHLSLVTRHSLHACHARLELLLFRIS